MKKFVALIAAGSMALTLAACGGNKEEAPVETNVINVVEPDNVALDNTLIETPTPTPSVTPVPADPGEDFSDSEQTQDDADATGMTARVPRGEDNATAPAQ